MCYNFYNWAFVLKFILAPEENLSLDFKECMPIFLRAYLRTYRSQN